MTKSLQTNRSRRIARTRFSVKAAAHGRPRLTVFRSGRHIYAQVISDEEGKTIAAASSVDTELKGKVKGTRPRKCGRGRQTVGPARGESRREGSDFRPWRLHVPRAHQGSGRCGPRSRPRVLSAFKGSNSWHGHPQEPQTAAANAPAVAAAAASDPAPADAVGVTAANVKAEAAIAVIVTRNSSTSLSTSTASPRW